ncbi:hypothetical protein [Brunnivagina elsteri]|uniref:hypothetical protein n=1 Tax=Brunnivagina elsteri TaxID=1247191 RepID=UPI0011778DF9|nr:hypothetical protein [Calothrix elsteri]
MNNLRKPGFSPRKKPQLARLSQKPNFYHHEKTPNTSTSSITKGKNPVSIGDAIAAETYLIFTFYKSPLGGWFRVWNCPLVYLWRVILVVLG